MKLQMLSNSDCFYQSVNRFCRERDAIEAAFTEATQRAEKAKGSPLYGELISKATKTRDAALQALVDDVAQNINSELRSMLEAAENRALTAPTTGQLNIVSLLKMWEAVTENELQQAAIALQGNALCIGAINELAEKNGIYHRYSQYAAQMPTGEAVEAVKTLARSARGLLHGDSGFCSSVKSADSKVEVINRMAAFPYTVDETHGVQTVKANETLVTLFCEAVDGRAR